MIIVYTRENCAYCPGVKKYLERLGVEFEERNGDPADATYQLYAQKYGVSVPLVVNTVHEQGVTGNNFGRIKEIVSL